MSVNDIRTFGPGQGTRFIRSGVTTRARTGRNPNGGHSEIRTGNTSAVVGRASPARSCATRIRTTRSAS